MALSKNRVVSEAVQTLEEAGFELSSVPFKETGKSAAEIIIDAVSDAVIAEIQSNGDVSTTVASGITVNVDPNTGIGTTTGTGTGTGGIQ